MANFVCFTHPAVLLLSKQTMRHAHAEQVHLMLWMLESNPNFPAWFTELMFRVAPEGKTLPTGTVSP